MSEELRNARARFIEAKRAYEEVSTKDAFEYGMARDEFLRARAEYEGLGGRVQRPSPRGLKLSNDWNRPLYEFKKAAYRGAGVEFDESMRPPTNPIGGYFAGWLPVRRVNPEDLKTLGEGALPMLPRWWVNRPRGRDWVSEA